MVSTEKALETDFMNADLVKNSPSKKLVILGEGKYEITDFGEKLTLPVEIDSKKKTWRPNRDSIKNMQMLGKDSQAWVGKAIQLQILTIKGKEAIIGFPHM